MASPAARKLLTELIRREGLNNKVCNDCNNPNPQWASLSFAVFLCLQCAGTHRGFGVHISFVRSVSMDAWQDDQLKRMELGGNTPFREFMKSYDASGGYTGDASTYDTYHCWAATQYREKLDALVAGKPWSPSAPPADHLSPASNNSRTNSPNPSGLRKSRAQTTRSNTGRSDSPASFMSNSPQPTASPGDQKPQNEAYFANLGKLNESRPVDLPPSQGGRYTGFGSTPTPPPGNASHPSFSLSSANAPSLGEIQENPMAALSKGWSLFSSAVIGASRTINDNVIQPGMGKINDPEFQASVKGYVNEAGKRAADVGGVANEWSKHQLGIDVADTVYGVKERVLGGPSRNGYDQVSGYGNGEESTALYDPDHPGDDDHFFGEFKDGGQGQGWVGEPTPQASPPVVMKSTTSTVTSRAKAVKKNDNWDDDWKDF